VFSETKAVRKITKRTFVNGHAKYASSSRLKFSPLSGGTCVAGGEENSLDGV
jgi:hypothetical protein